MKKVWKRNLAVILALALCMTQNVSAIFGAEDNAEKEVITPVESVQETGEEAEAPGEQEEDAAGEAAEPAQEEEADAEEDKDAVAAAKEDDTEEPAGDDGDVLPEADFAAAIGQPEQITMTAKSYLGENLSFSYSYDFVEPVSHRQPYRWNIIFAENGTAPLTISEGTITRAEIDSATGWEWEELGSVYKPKGKNWNPNTGTIYFGDGIFFAGKKIIDKWEWETSVYKGLKPGKTYDYYIAIAPDDKQASEDVFYVKTDKNTFTTESGRSSTSIVKDGDINVEYNDGEWHVKDINLNNPDQEYILGYCFEKEGLSTLSEAGIKTAYNEERLIIKNIINGGNPVEDDFFITEDADVETYPCLYAVVFTGTDGYPSYSLVNLGKPDFPAAPERVAISDGSISVSYSAGIRSVTAVIDYNCGDNGESLDGVSVRVSINAAGKTAYVTNTLATEIWAKDEKGYHLRSTYFDSLGGDVEDEEVSIQPGTTYQLKTYVGKFRRDADGKEIFKGVETEWTDVRTEEESYVPKSEFDPGFLNFLEDEGVLQVPEGDTVSQSELDDISFIESYCGYGISNLKGVKHLRNLNYIEINDNALMDISALSENTSVTYAEFMENKLETLPDLSGTVLKRLNLDWNYIRSDLITTDKLPATLESEGTTLQDVADQISSTQHRFTDFNITHLYLQDGSGKYPFKMGIRNGKIKPFDPDKYDMNQASFYILKAYTEGNEPSTDSLSDDAIMRVGIFYGGKSGTENENIKEIAKEFSLDQVYVDKGGPEEYGFNVKSVSGINTAGEHSVIWKLIKRNVIWDGEGTDYKTRDIEIFTHGEDVVYKKGSVSVTVSPKNLELSLGHKSKLTATVTAIPDSLDKSVSWSSDKPGVATVDAEGNVTGVGIGTATITAKSKFDPTRSASCTVTVKEVEPVGIELKGEGGKNTVFVGKTLALTPVFTPADASVDLSKVSYNVIAGKDFISLSGNLITGIKEGSASITAEYTVAEGKVLKTANAMEVTVRRTSEAEKKFYTVTFVSGDQTIDTKSVLEGQPVDEPAQIPTKTGAQFIGWSLGSSLWNFTTPVTQDMRLMAEFREEKVEVSANSGSGKDSQPAVETTTDGGTIYLVKGQSYTAGGKGWSSDNSSVAKVVANSGKITAAGAGTATVQNSSLKYTVKVAEPSMKAVKPADAVVKKGVPQITLYTGETAELAVDGIKENTDKYPITWYSSKPLVAQVNNGIVTAMSKGKAEIRAYVGGKTYKAKITVNETYAKPNKITTGEATIDIAALQSVNLKFDTKKFKVNEAAWTGDGLKEVSGNSSTKSWQNDVIKITDKGKLTGAGEGTTKITGEDSQGNKVVLTVNVSIHAPKAGYINKGKTKEIKFANLSSKKADWTVFDKTVASLKLKSNKEYAKGEAVGSTVITAQSSEYSKPVFETMLYVEDPKLKADAAGKITINNKGVGTLKLNRGDVYVINTSGIYQSVTFESSKIKVAFVDENGVIYARNKGKTVVSTKVNGKALKINVTVE